ncbi:methyl-CpG-binding protein 2-like [Heracleum sosnowskyi]|uniref:Methyl-CpG-binding protein 2-like n=1 Tax=Heracleum sosnowskyi TaxID=360622 RepID=A0AAD8GVQ7_9APIA|nr:methyl-CpG-binding protein 2-like [Heracleum sosnowskyi]
MNKHSGTQQLRSGKIPAFGNWDQVKELPITQYFENARQAGLKTTNASNHNSRQLNNVAAQNNMYISPHFPGNNKKRNTTIKTYTHFQKCEKKVGKISYAGGMHKQNQLQNQNITTATGVASASHRKLLPIIKPVDEDLYKIPSEILHNSNRKKFFGFFSRCFVPHTT